MPANLPGLTLSTTGTLADLSATLKRVDTDEEVPLEQLAGDQVEGLEDWAVFLQPEAPFEAGVTYELTLNRRDCTEPVVARYEAQQELELPDELGGIEVLDTSQGDLQLSSDGPCSEQIEAAQVVIELQPSAKAEAWLPFLHFTTLVDGDVWRPSANATSWPAAGASWEGRGVDRLYVGCGTDAEGRGLEPGTHSVRFVATLPGSELELETPAVEVTLRCAGDDSPPGQDPAASAEPATSEGCSLAGSAGRGGTPLLTALAALAALAALVRRRRATR